LPTLINIFCSEFLQPCSQGSAALFDNVRFQILFKLSWYFFVLFFRCAWGTSDKKMGHTQYIATRSV